MRTLNRFHHDAKSRRVALLCAVRPDVGATTDAWDGVAEGVDVGPVVIARQPRPGPTR